MVKGAEKVFPWKVKRFCFSKYIKLLFQGALFVLYFHLFYNFFRTSQLQRRINKMAKNQPIDTHFCIFCYKHFQKLFCIFNLLL